MLSKNIQWVPLLLTLMMSSSIFAEDQTIRKIPVALGLASHPVNGGRCLISDGVHQYLAFYDGDHQLTVAKRKLGDTIWEFAKLPEKVGWDTHNRVVIFLDREGYLHLTGNMHAAPLRYYRTKKAGDIQTFEPIHTWTGKDEERVTYPNLLVLRDGSVHMMYRSGVSGNGKRLLIHYDEKTQKWTGTGNAFISGMDHDPDCNAYPFGEIQEDCKGVLHIAWCWRETPDVMTNYDVCYAQSRDGGYTWNRWDGTPYDLPIRPGNAEVVDDIPQKAGLMNGGSVTVDNQGNPYIGYTRFDAQEYNQVYVATPVEKKWKVIQITNFQEHLWFEGGGTIPVSPPVPQLSLTEAGMVRIEIKGKEAELSREQILTLTPGQYPFHPVPEVDLGIADIRAENQGPLPLGEMDYMQQAVDHPNRDRKPENPRMSTMIYLVEMKKNTNP